MVIQELLWATMFSLLPGQEVNGDARAVARPKETMLFLGAPGPKIHGNTRTAVGPMETIFSGLPG